MTPPLPLVGGDTLVVSPTQLEVLRTCPAMWKHRYLYRRVKATPNAAAQGGKAFDTALNLRYQRHGSSPCTPETEADMLALIDKSYEGVELPLDEHRTPLRYKEAIQGYNQHWGAEPFRVLGVQVPFKVELGQVGMDGDFWHVVHAKCSHDWYVKPEQMQTDPADPMMHCKKCQAVTFAKGGPITWGWGQVRVVLQGLLDLYVQLGDHILIPDTKTSNSDIDGNYDNSAQLKAYCWAMQELARLYPDKGLPPKVHGAFVNGVIIRPDYKNPTRTPKGNDKPRLEFKRTFPSFYSEERLERWRRDTLLWVEQALGWVARDHFPQNERHCTFHVDAAFKNYGTYGQQCPYMSVCPLPPEQHEMVLASDEYMDYERGPLAALDVAVEEAP